jgi:hypothetical protein
MLSFGRETWVHWGSVLVIGFGPSERVESV